MLFLRRRSLRFLLFYLGKNRTALPVDAHLTDFSARVRSCAMKAKRITHVCRSVIDDVKLTGLIR